jgi:hypothetical protein
MDLLTRGIFSISAEIKVGFTLQKPVSFLTSHIDKLGNDIFEEIGVPNSKVPDASLTCTRITFCFHSWLIQIFSCAGFHCFNAALNH